MKPGSSWHMFLLVLPVLLAGLLLADKVAAHEVRPAYLKLSQTSADDFSVLWKLPLSQGRVPDISLQLPKHCQAISKPFTEVRDGTLIQTWQSSCNFRDSSSSIKIVGLPATLIDIIATIEWLDGSSSHHLITAIDPTWLALPGNSETGELGLFLHGMLHILSGLDHLALLLCILLYSQLLRSLLIMVTAFTLGHSLSLFLVAYDLIWIPAAPIEALIAFSIVLLACEVLGQERRAKTSKQTWVLALSFGLLHGLGFAGGLKNIGMTGEDIFSNTLIFNLGIEAGQVLFILATYALLRSLRHFSMSWSNRIQYITANSIGFLAMFWTLQRVDIIWV